MTLIAAFALDHMPIVMGDLLVSRLVELENQISIPTIGVIAGRHRVDSRPFVSGLRQKIVQISDHLVIAWAGRSSEACRVISSLEFMSSIGGLSIDDLERIRRDLNLDAGDEIIGLSRNSTETNMFGWNITPIDTEDFGQCYVGGSGAGFLVDNLYPELIRFNQLSGGQTPGNLDISKALMISNNLIFEELCTAESIEHNFGGGYEIAFPGQRRLQKLDDILRLFWICENAANTMIARFVPIILKFDYLDDILVDRTLRVAEPKASGTTIDTYLVQRPSLTEIALDSMISEKIAKLDWNATHMVATFGHNIDGAQKAVYATVNSSISRKQPFQIEMEGSSINISWNLSYWQRALEGAFNRPVKIHST